jgi:hypothetical protein
MKILKLPALVEAKSNIKQLKILIERYAPEQKKYLLTKIKKEQNAN